MVKSKLKQFKKKASSDRQTTRSSEVGKYKKGTKVNHYRFGKGTVDSLDDKTYTYPFLVVKLKSGEKICRPLEEWKKD